MVRSGWLGGQKHEFMRNSHCRHLLHGAPRPLPPLLAPAARIAAPRLISLICMPCLGLQLMRHSFSQLFISLDSRGSPPNSAALSHFLLTHRGCLPSQGDITCRILTPIHFIYKDRTELQKISWIGIAQPLGRRRILFTPLGSRLMRCQGP